MKMSVTGILILLLGILIFLLVMDEISGLTGAIIIGLIIGSAFALKKEFEKQ